MHHLQWFQYVFGQAEHVSLQSYGLVGRYLADMMDLLCARVGNWTEKGRPGRVI